MQARKLDQRIEIHNPSQERLADGSHSTGQLLVWPCWANVQSAEGTEGGDNVVASEASVTFSIRYVRQIDGKFGNASLIKHRNIWHGVKSVSFEPAGRPEFFRIKAVRKGAE